MKDRHFIIIAAIAVCVGIMFLLSYSNKKQVIAKVNNIEKIENTRGDKDGFSTEIYYLVMTDNGTFRVDIQGFFAYPHLAGKIKKDSTYIFDIIGVEVPVLGIYSNIINVK